MHVEQPALACLPDAIPSEERAAHFERIRRLFHTVRERRTLADGFAFRFDPDALPELARFIENERRCCPFLTFTVQQGPEIGPLWLRLTGPEGTREFLELELEL